MDSEASPTQQETPALAQADKVFFLGLGMTFLLSVGCMIANYAKPNSVPSEPIWAFAAVVLGHKISADKYNSQNL